ncbi:hypothetical protein K431DRAFT_235231 [Polychaeton citri CBS 116435]|uniref:DNA-directed DNA polymerase n=1 Tax=Polychaeton citri CBS 116435 TaxID=1314669 RepID=A0A9P4PZ58_9PEZI|nr:hypothetical protein K431DRAFT_235231 [Polychaeton citri CBS 116435]
MRDGQLLAKPDHDTLPQDLTRADAAYHAHPSYLLPFGSNRHYQQQYADMYFLRLAALKKPLESLASEVWSDFSIAGEAARCVDRVLDVRQGELCWVIGTVYMEMPLKPNVLDDIGKEHWIAAPPPRVKYTSGDGDQMMLEDESGRLRLTGGFLQGCFLVTGAIVAVLGTENKDGEFEVLDIRVPDLPRQPQRWESEQGQAAVNGTATSSQPGGDSGKVAIVSGLGITGDAGDLLSLDLLMEYILGESLSDADQESAAQISRLIIAGNSLSHGSPIASREDVVSAAKKQGVGAARKYGYDSSAYNAAPTSRLDSFLSTLLPSLPITLLPGEHDPTSTALPQQPIHPAMFPQSRAYMEPPAEHSHKSSWFHTTTNPADFDLAGWRFLGTGGQTVNDVYKYVDCEDRLTIIEAMLRWRLTAPTAPDTLWCYPFQDRDQFVLTDCPHVYFVGNQPKFESRIIEGPLGQQVRLVAVPSFKETGEMVLLDLETLEPELVKVQIYDG